MSSGFPVSANRELRYVSSAYDTGEATMTDASMMMGAVEDIRKHSGWFLFLGIAFIIGGIAALAMPFLASISVALLVGWSLIFVGAVQIFQAWSIRTWGGF